MCLTYQCSTSRVLFKHNVMYSIKVQWSPARNFNSHYCNFLKVNNKSNDFVLISMLHEYVLFSNVMYINPTVNSVYVNIFLMSFLFSMFWKMEMSYDYSFSSQWLQESGTEWDASILVCADYASTTQRNIASYIIC